MSDYRIILINGISATGKTTIGRQIAERLKLPFFAKDAIKERLFDELGYSDREWAHKLSGVTHSVLNYVLEEELKCGRSFVMEANFNPQFDAYKYRAWSEKYGFDVVQVLCFAEGEIVFDRFRKRVESGERHPGHVDHLHVEAYRAYLMKGKCTPLDIPGKVVHVDTTDFSNVNLNEILRQIEEPHA